MFTKMKRAFVVPAAIVATSAAAFGLVSSGAIFTDSTTNGGNVLTTGTIDLTTAPASGTLTMSGMMPGDSKVGEITVTNSGTEPLRYSVATATTNADAKALADALNTDVKVGVTTCDVANFAATGTAVGVTTPLSSVAIGAATQGGQAGDRTLAAGATEKLCIKAALPLTAGNALQNATTTATFTFSAEQTKNNA